MIKPTVGRIVHIWKRSGVHERHQPEAGQICLVHDDPKYVNIGGFNSLGTPFSATSVPLVQEGEPAPDGVHATWMPYQVAVAKGEIAPVLHAEPPPVDNAHVEPGAEPFGE